MAFIKTNKDIFFSREDSDDPRLGDLATHVDKIKNLKDAWVIGGYPDDEGIRTNLGRVGAREAPAQIRKYFYKMTPHLLLDKTVKLGDLGDVEVRNTLDERQSRAIEDVKDILKSGARYIGLGGGHD